MGSITRIGIILGIASLLVCESRAAGPLVEKYLHSGDFPGGEKALLEELNLSPREARARKRAGTLPMESETRFGLGTLQFIQAVEGLTQDMYRYGLRPDFATRLNIPFFRLPVPANPNPVEIDYQKFRGIFTRFMAGLTKAEKNLALVRDPDVKLPIRMGLIKLDINADGIGDEPFKTILGRYMGGGNNPFQFGDMAVTFDRGDAIWLQGYCNLLMAMGSVILAHDHKETFEVAGSLFFPKVKTPHEFLNQIPRGPAGWFPNDILDIIAFIHMWRFPLKDPQKMQDALAHLEKVIALSRESWKSILEETDNDNEWLPNPRQTGVMGIGVRRQMVDGWMEFLDEAENILQGKKLVPLWRDGEVRGVNVRRVFTHPRDLDLILWIQGTAATPYLEAGPTSSSAVWNRMQQVFGGQFFGFAFWFN